MGSVLLGPTWDQIYSKNSFKSDVNKENMPTISNGQSNQVVPSFTIQKRRSSQESATDENIFEPFLDPNLLVLEFDDFAVPEPPVPVYKRREQQSWDQYTGFNTE